LADRDADAPIFGKLGFTYGKAARFKKEFETKKASYGSAHARPCSPAPSKPTMAEMSSFTPEMKRLYLSKYAMGLIDYLMSCCGFDKLLPTDNRVQIISSCKCRLFLPCLSS